MSIWVSIQVRRNFVVGSSGGNEELAPSPQVLLQREQDLFFFLMSLFLTT